MIRFVPDVELTLTAAPDEVPLLPGAPTRVWRFTSRLLKGPADTLQTLRGSYLGPVIRRRLVSSAARTRPHSGWRTARRIRWLRRGWTGSRDEGGRGDAWVYLLPIRELS